MNDLSVVIHTYNEAGILPRALESVKDIASEIIIYDAKSTDNIAEIAKKYKAKIFYHDLVSYVELVRNQSISKASNKWILILDADEEISKGLSNEIAKAIKNPKADYYRIPRKNIIFGKWIAHSRWWPDYNIRLFKKGFVSWNEIIHTVPMTKGKGGDFSDKQDLAIIHNSYKDIDEYFSKMLRYTKAQAENLKNDGYKFKWQDIITKPTNEFLSRYFSGKGYKDGVHGLVLSLLQAFSELVLYIRLWNYKVMNIDKLEINTALTKNIKDLKWWMRKEFSWLKNLPFVS